MFSVFKHAPFKKETVGILNYINLRKLNKLRTPENIIFFVTNNCNAKCKHCFYWRSLNEKDILNLIQIKKIVSSLKNRVSTLLITGGEPLLRNDIYDIIKLFYDINHLKKIQLVSNGSMPEKLYKLSNRILNTMDIELSIQISIDGDEKYHNELRGVKIYSKAVESLKLLKRLEKDGLLLSSLTVLTKENLNQIDSVSKKMEELGVNWGFQILRDSNKGIIGLDKDFINNYNPKENLSPSIKEIKELVNKYYIKDDLDNVIKRSIFKISLEVLNNQKPDLKCVGGISDAVIYSSGDVALCEVAKPFDNLKNYNFDFYELWKSKKANLARGKIKNCSCIHPCHIINSMKYDYRCFI